MNKIYIVINIFLFTLLVVDIQANTISGLLQDANTGEAIPKVLVSVQGQTLSALTNEEGRFTINSVDPGNQTLIFSLDNFETVTKIVEVLANENLDVGLILMTPSVAGQEEDMIPIITLDNDEDGSNGGQENISALLTASRDPFVNAASFTFGTRRFRIKGYDSENSLTYLNGVPINDLENGRVVWSYWGGLNDVMRNREGQQVGLEAMDFYFWWSRRWNSN